MTNPEIPDCCLHREALPLDDVTICLLEGPCDFAKPIAHRSHALHSRPGENRLQITRRSVMSAARRIASSSMPGSLLRLKAGVTTENVVRVLSFTSPSPN